MNIFSKAAIVGSLGAALAAGIVAPAAYAAESTRGAATTASWSMAIAPDYTTGNQPTDAIYLTAGDSWSGTVELNGDGDLKYYLPNDRGGMTAEFLFCGVEGAGAMSVDVTVAADGSFVLTCG